MKKSSVKKPRPINSCIPCRKRRVRCDKVRPICGRCQEISNECTYREADDIQATLENRQKADDIATRGEGTTGQTGQRIENFDINLMKLKRRLLERLETHGTVRDGLLTGFGGRVTYHSPLFWGSTISQDGTFQEGPVIPVSLPKWSSLQGGDPDFHNSRIARLQTKTLKLTQFGMVDTCPLCGRHFNLRCALAVLPSKETCDVLCDAFLVTIYPLMPLLHLPTFRVEYETFWEGMAKGDPHTHGFGTFIGASPSFVPLLFSMLFAGMMIKSAQSSKRPNTASEYEVSGGDLFFLTMISLKAVGFPQHPSIYALAAYAFSQTQILREEEFIESPRFIDTAFRVAFRMGLHRDDRVAGLHKAESELRKRLWWQIIHLDVMASASSGLSPLFISEGMANIPSLSVYEDVVDDEMVPRKIDIRHLVTACRYRMSKEIRRVIRLHFDNEMQTSDQLEEATEKLKAMSSEVSNVSKMLVEATSQHSTADHEILDPLARNSTAAMPRFELSWRLPNEELDDVVLAFLSWAPIVLHLLVHRVFCVLLQPLYRNEDQRDTVRLRTIHHAQAYLQLYLRLCEHPMAYAYQWMYPNTYQPLQALSILIADLLNYPNSEEAPNLRGLVDATFELYEADEGVIGHSGSPSRQLSPVSREAWNMLLRARRRALEQMNHDPHVLLPSFIPTGPQCICGETIAHETPSTVEESISDPQANIREVSNIFPPTEETAWGPSPDMNPGYIPMGFDWDEWDSLVGNREF